MGHSQWKEKKLKNERYDSSWNHNTTAENVAGSDINNARFCDWCKNKSTNNLECSNSSSRSDCYYRVSIKWCTCQLCLSVGLHPRFARPLLAVALDTTGLLTRTFLHWQVIMASFHCDCDAAFKGDNWSRSSGQLCSIPVIWCALLAAMRCEKLSGNCRRLFFQVWGQARVICQKKPGGVVWLRQRKCCRQRRNSSLHICSISASQFKAS